jgi:hypothetical protein
LGAVVVWGAVVVGWNAVVVVGTGSVFPARDEEPPPEIRATTITTTTSAATSNKPAIRVRDTV